MNFNFQQYLGFIINACTMITMIVSWDTLPAYLKILFILLLLIGFFLILSTRFLLIPYACRKTILEKELKNSKKVFFIVHVGTVIAGQKKIFEDNNKKFSFILTKPGSNAIDVLSKICEVEADKLNLDVIDITNIIRKNKSSTVRWFDGLLGSSIIISDPDSAWGWVKVESLLPYTASVNRPSIKIYKRYNKEIFSVYTKLWDELLDKSENPPIDLHNRTQNATVKA